MQVLSELLNPLKVAMSKRSTFSSMVSTLTIQLPDPVPLSTSTICNCGITYSIHIEAALRGPWPDVMLQRCLKARVGELTVLRVLVPKSFPSPFRVAL